MDLNDSCTFQFAMWLGQGLLDLRLVSKVGCRAVCIPVCHTLLISINTQKSYLFVAVTVLSCQENWSFSMTVFMTLLIKKVFIQLRATRYRLWHSYLRLSNGSLQSECVWTRIPAALNSPTSRLQNKVLLNQLERQLFSGPSHTVCNKMWPFHSVLLFWLLSVITGEILSLSTQFFCRPLLSTLLPVKLQVKAQPPEHYSVVPTGPYQDLLCCNHYVVSDKTPKPFLYVWVETQSHRHLICLDKESRNYISLKLNRQKVLHRDKG